MICLGIESSCDDTSLALVKDGNLLAQESASQAELHALFGGVVPEVASREHARYIGILFERLMERVKLIPSDIDIVAVARGPGLLGSLLVGVAFAKALALGINARFIGVNHLHAHLLAAGLEQELVFPALGLLVSGGHTHLYRIEGPDSIFLLGKTLDDAAGEAFDKAGKMLGLPYPAGRIIDELAEEGSADVRLFPRPYLGNNNLDFSFSGLKTAMHSHLALHPEVKTSFDAVSGRPMLPEGSRRTVLADLCASYRLAVVETLAIKTERALASEAAQGTRMLILAGGVACNALLRRVIADCARRWNLLFAAPSPELCTDNGAMIAFLGFALAAKGYYHDLSMEAVARGRAVPDDIRRQA